MLVLTAEEVSRCTVTLDGTVASFPGLEFKQRVYAATPYEFSLKELTKALTQCRILLDQGVFCLVVQEATKISLWVQKANLRRVDQPRAATFQGTVLGQTPRTPAKEVPLPERTMRFRGQAVH